MSVKWNLLNDLFEDRKFFSVVWSFVKLRQYMYFLGVNFVLLTVLCIVWIIIYIFSYFFEIMNAFPNCFQLSVVKNPGTRDQRRYYDCAKCQDSSSIVIQQRFRSFTSFMAYSQPQPFSSFFQTSLEQKIIHFRFRPDQIQNKIPRSIPFSQCMKPTTCSPAC